MDEKNQTVYLGIPNDFVAQQVKKFFNKDLGIAIKQHFNPQYTISYTIYPALQAGDHDLQLDLKKLLQVHITDKHPQHSLEAAHRLDESTKATMTSYFGILFEKRFSFDNFVVGANSQLAYSAAEAVAREPGKAYNPLFIYGDVGL
ncbi:MAG: hypothetical protein H6765_07530 [Candidatus Peribacteria bacterium]|nr:MAG: hypothetical protein H6765_07530 [Candidatus Peribacteria bacterium]